MSQLALDGIDACGAHLAFIDAVVLVDLILYQRLIVRARGGSIVNKLARWCMAVGGPRP